MPRSSLPAKRLPASRRRIPSPAAPHRRPAAAVARRSGPSTPQLKWMFDDPDRSIKPRRNAAAAAALPVPTRKLGAVMWQHGPVTAYADAAASACGGDRLERTRQRFEPVAWHLQTPHVCHSNSKSEVGSQIPNPNPKNRHKLGHASALFNSAMEKATKWDPVRPKKSDMAYLFSAKLDDHDGQKVDTLERELENAHNRIAELEAEQLSSKRKMDHILRKIAEEKASWRSREHEKIRAVIDEMKDELNRERKNRKQVEIVKSKLVSELTEAKLSAKRFLQEYEKERKGREIMEEVCDELAKEMAEDKAEVEALKRDCLKIREEVEDERRMLQMAEVWREERVQMKLIDAKVTLEEKYSQVSKLESDLEAFLRMSSGNSDPTEIREAESLRETAKLVKIKDIMDFSYQPPPASEDIYSVFEELRPKEETNGRDIEQCYEYSPASHGSKIHTVSPATDLFLKKSVTRYDNRLFDRDVDPEDDSGWETMSQDEQGSSNSPAGSDPSVNGGMCRGSNVSASGTDWEENGYNDTLNSEIIEVCSETTRQSRKKTSSISRLWKTSAPNNAETYKKILLEAINGKISNGRISTGMLSPDKRSGDMDFSPSSVGHWSSPDAANPHITRGMKGCIEWPRGTQKHSLQAKLLEARMESQKIQLRQALKQKI